MEFKLVSGSYTLWFLSTSAYYRNYTVVGPLHMYFGYTVEPPIVDPPTKGHNIIDLSTKDTGQSPKILFPYSSSTF